MSASINICSSVTPSGTAVPAGPIAMQHFTWSRSTDAAKGWPEPNGDGVVRAEIGDGVLGARHESCVIGGHLHRCRSALSPGESPQSLGQEVPCHRRAGPILVAWAVGRRSRGPRTLVPKVFVAQCRRHIRNGGRHA
jgi:hypothetical protein